MPVDPSKVNKKQKIERTEKIEKIEKEIYEFELYVRKETGCDRETAHDIMLKAYDVFFSGFLK